MTASDTETGLVSVVMTVPGLITSLQEMRTPLRHLDMAFHHIVQTKRFHWAPFGGMPGMQGQTELAIENAPDFLTAVGLDIYPGMWEPETCVIPKYTTSVDAVLDVVDGPNILTEAYSRLASEHALHMRFWNIEKDGVFRNELAVALMLVHLESLKEMTAGDEISFMRLAREYGNRELTLGEMSELIRAASKELYAGRFSEIGIALKSLNLSTMHEDSLTGIFRTCYPARDKIEDFDRLFDAYERRYPPYIQET